MKTFSYRSIRPARARVISVGGPALTTSVRSVYRSRVF